MTNPLLAGLRPQHPGEFLAEFVLPALKADNGIGKAAFAELLHLSRMQMSRILKGEAPVTTDTALRLGKLLGNGAEFWTTMQANYDLKLAEVRLAAELESLPTFKAA